MARPNATTSRYVVVGSRKNSTQPTDSLPAICYSPFASSFLPYSLLATRYSLLCSLPPTRGVRSAGGARMHARHPSRRVMTDAQTPHRFAQTGRTRLAFIAHHGRTRRAIDLRKPGNHPACMRRLAFPATGRSPFGAPRGISGPGPCSPLSGIPSRIVRQPHMPHGSSLPGGAGLANLPGAAANRLRGHHNLAPPYRIASGGAPLERGWVCYMYCYGMCQAENAHRS